MTHPEILTKALERALANGYTLEFEKGTRADHQRYALKHPLKLETLIYDHGFAKALWGEGYETDEDGTPEFPEMGMFIEHNWQHHLQQMVIADDPIAYLGEHLP